MIVPEQPAEPRVAADLPRDYRWSSRHDRFVPKPLMWALIVIVLDILADQVVKMLPANWHEVIEAFSLERFDKPLDVSIHQRRFDRERVRFHTFVLKRFIEISCVQHIIIAHKNGWGVKAELLDHLWEALGNSTHPITGWMSGGFRDDDSAALDVHEYKCGVSLEPSWCKDFLRKEIA